MQQTLLIFITIFLAELGDKTQVATLLFATDADRNPLEIFLVATAALAASTAAAVALGMTAGQYLTVLPIKLLAGVGFIVIGLWTILDYFSAG